MIDSWKICLHMKLDQLLLQYNLFLLFVETQTIIRRLPFFVEKQTFLSRLPLFVEKKISYITLSASLLFDNYIVISHPLSKALCITPSIWSSYMHLMNRNFLYYYTQSFPLWLNNQIIISFHISKVLFILHHYDSLIFNCYIVHPTFRR